MSLDFLLTIQVTRIWSFACWVGYSAESNKSIADKTGVKLSVGLIYNGPTKTVFDSCRSNINGMR